MGLTEALSSMKSPNSVSPSLSPTLVWSETGCWLMRSTALTRSTGRWISSAISSGVGSRPSSCTSCFCTRSSLLMVSIMCTGMRMVRAWSAMLRVMAWRIHQVA